MKRLLLAALLFSPLPAFADSEYFLTWSIAPGLSDPKFKTLELEVNQLRKYFAVNGALIDGQNGYAPANGTCFLLRSTGVNTGISCTFEAWGQSFGLDTDTNLTGTLTERDTFGKITGSALVTLISGQ